MLQGIQGVSFQSCSQLSVCHNTVLQLSKSNHLHIKAGTEKCDPPDAPSENLRISADATASVSTCQPINLDITGGKKPYQATIVPLNSLAVTNISLGLSDDRLTYIEQLEPSMSFLGEYNTSLPPAEISPQCFVVAVSDALVSCCWHIGGCNSFADLVLLCTETESGA